MKRPQPILVGAMFALIALWCVSLVSAVQAVEPGSNRDEHGARPLPLSAVRLTGGPLKHAQDLDAKYLLELEPDRMLAFYRDRAGLKPKAKPYGGWDGPGKNLTGHIGGHYLSAVSLMWATTGDERFKQRADYMVRELKEVQDKHGDGYLCAFEGGRECFEKVRKGDIKTGGFDLNGLWVPWYTLHKTMAGLRDAYRHTGNRTALEMGVKIANWVEAVLADLTEAQVQNMLDAEFGGMNEVLADLYADTGDRRWLALSHRFEHHRLLGPLKRHQDVLPGIHGNTQVPKLVGSAARYAYAQDPQDIIAASFFWDRVVQHHSFATGGHGRNEYFGQPDEHNDRIDGRTAESCNIYNMLKLTRRLFALRPDAHYAEFHERALLNHVLSSIDPQDGRTCYMVPVGRGVRREYSDMLQSFTCCVGTGMESHALHADGIYYESGDRLWVNLYAPSTAKWESAGAAITMQTDLPIGDSATLSLKLVEPKSFTFALRRPKWAGEGYEVHVNDKPITDLPAPGSYVEVERTWKTGDTVTLALPKQLHLEPLPDNPRRTAILWGPLVLAGDLGPEDQKELARDEITGLWKVPVFVAAERPVAEWLKPIDGKPGHFRTDGVGRDQDVEFAPFYRLHRRMYGVYWDLFTPAEWKKEEAAYAAKQQERQKLEAATVAHIQPGEMQPERDFNYRAAEGAHIVRLQGQPGRRSAAWFSFDVPVDPSQPMTLVVTRNHDEWRRRTFDILIDGELLKSVTMERRGPLRFFDTEYAIPATMLKDKKRVTVRFRATHGNETAAIYGIRMIRTNTPQ